MDLAMRSREGSRDVAGCSDWLLAQSVGYKNSAAMTCGQLSSAVRRSRDRELVSRGSRLLLHFHTDQRPSPTNLPLTGFRLTLTGTYRLGVQ